MSSPEQWVASLRELHDTHFAFDWSSHLTDLNDRLGLTGSHEFGLPEGLAPAWFVGDVEALPPDDWVLVVSLNQARRQEGDAWHLAQRYTRQSYWDHWRFLNRNWWEPRFYRPLVRVAAGALGVAVNTTNEAEFATTRMIFVEVCPYPSRQFQIDDFTLIALADDDLGFELAGRVRRLLIDEASPALILVNGAAAVRDFERLESGRVGLRERRYESVAHHGRELWHREGHFETARRRVPVVGFPFLRKPRTHNSYAEVDQLAAMARRLVRPGERSAGGPAPRDRAASEER